jgi:hypothetical protein
MRKLAAVTTGILIILFSCTTAYTEDTTKSDNWEFQLTPFYVWALNMSGGMTVNGETSSVDVSFSDITDHLEYLVTGHLEGMHKSNWGFLTDISYITIGGDMTTPKPTLNLDVDFTSVMYELAVIYRINEGANALDFIGGIRYYDLELEIDIIGTPPRGASRWVDIDDEQDWVDAMLGARYTWAFTDKLKLMARADIGFGGSNHAYNFESLFWYKPWKHASFIFGYRYMDIDYEDGSGSNLFEYDITMKGPVLGLNFVW